MERARIVIYSVLPRLWGNTEGGCTPNGTLEENGSGKFSSWTEESLSYVKSLGCTHIWLIGVIEHATATAYKGIEADPSEIVKGVAGSPYAIKDYYDVSPELADVVEERMDEFHRLIERVHKAGLKLIIDFVPNHVARTYASDAAPKGVQDIGQADNKQEAFSAQNNFYYFPNESLHLPTEVKSYEEYPARATGNDCFSAYPSRNDWYETVKLNYGVDYLGGHTSFEPIPNTWHRMYEILCFWASKGVDGFRCDMAEMVPPQFWAWALPQVKANYPVFFLAEIYQAHRYQEYLSAGFDYLYDKVGVYDTLKSIVRGEQSADAFDMARLATREYQEKMCYFLENHDEQRFASPFYAGHTKSLYPALTALYLSGSNPYLHYFAGELGESGMDEEGFSGRDGRTTIFDYWSMASLQRLGLDFGAEHLHQDESLLLDFHRQILTLPEKYSVLDSGQYYGLNYLQTQAYDRYRVLSYLRYEKGKEWVLISVNFSSETKPTSLQISEAVFSEIGLKPNEALRQTNLLSGVSQISTLTNYAPYEFVLPPYGISIIHFNLIDTDK